MIMIYIGTALSIVAAMTILINYHSKKRLLKSLQRMMDEAIEGSYKVEHLDESMVSLLENTMHRFLEDCDISKKNIEDQKQKIQTLISDISHQSTTPISNILLYTELLQEKDKDQIYKGEVAAIQDQTNKLSFLIHSLVEMSRLENGIIKVKTKQGNIQDVLEAAVFQIRAKAEEKEIEITIEDTKEQAFYDKKWTTEAVYNLVDNAVKYTHAGGKVQLSVVPFSMFLEIKVVDTGIGISEEEINEIYGRFYRSQEVSEQEGVGIGLYLAREIVTIQGGYMRVRSEIGKGSTFSIFLPREEGRA